MKLTTQLFLTASIACLFACSQENNNTSTETATAADISAPSATATPQPAVTTSVDSVTGQPSITFEGQPENQANQPTAAGMNPPHGQPGHRCDIAVGAPLNSPANAAPTSENSAPAASNTISPVFNAPGSAPAVAGTNPPHGEPGHDCSIPVGAPLKK